MGKASSPAYKGGIDIPVHQACLWILRFGHICSWYGHHRKHRGKIIKAVEPFCISDFFLFFFPNPKLVVSLLLLCYKSPQVLTRFPATSCTTLHPLTSIASFSQLLSEVQSFLFIWWTCVLASLFCPFHYIGLQFPQKLQASPCPWNHGPFLAFHDCRRTLVCSRHLNREKYVLDSLHRSVI